MAQDYDVSIKHLIDHFTEDYVRLILGNVEAQIELLDRELAATKYYIDALAQVTIENERFILHAEFVGDYDKHIPERMYKYSGRIMDKYPGLAVYRAVFYINENAGNKDLPNAFTRSILGKARCSHAFDVIEIWKLDAATILRERITGLLPQDFSELLKPLNISILGDLVVKAMSIENLAAFAALATALRETKANGAAHHSAN